MAQIYMEKDMLDNKAAEVMELAERIEHGLYDNNVIDLAAWDLARQHIQSRQSNAARLKG